MRKRGSRERKRDPDPGSKERAGAETMKGGKREREREIETGADQKRERGKHEGE